MRALIAVLVLALAIVAPAALARPDDEQKKIDYLITSIERLDGATFIRNGSAYDAPRAADHMRTKLKYAGEKVQTAEQFIDELASKSSMSGVKYLIKLKDGTVLESADFFRRKLAQYRP